MKVQINETRNSKPGLRYITGFLLLMLIVVGILILRSVSKDTGQPAPPQVLEDDLDSDAVYHDLDNESFIDTFNKEPDEMPEELADDVSDDTVDDDMVFDEQPMEETDLADDMPDVTGLSKDEAVSILENAGFAVKTTNVQSDVVEPGYVISQNSDGSSIEIEISEAMIMKVNVPNVIGRTETEAIAMLEENGLSAGSISWTTNDDVSLSGRVCYQSYSAGSYVEEGTVIDLKLGTRPESNIDSDADVYTVG